MTYIVTTVNINFDLYTILFAINQDVCGVTHSLAKELFTTGKLTKKSINKQTNIRIPKQDIGLFIFYKGAVIWCQNGSSGAIYNILVITAFFNSF